jgi:hypothetical protein
MYMCIGKPEKYTHPTSLIAGLTPNTAEDCKAGRQEPALRRSIPMRVSCWFIRHLLPLWIDDHDRTNTAED